MKHRTIITILSLSVLLSACTTDKKALEQHRFDNKIFIDTRELVDEVLVKPKFDGTISRKLSAATALKAEERITGRFVAAPEYLEKYRQAYYDDEVILLPDDKLVITDQEFSIEPGTSLSTSSEVSLSKLDGLDRNLVYVMPVKLEVDNDIDILRSKDVAYFIVKGASLINVVANLSKNRAYPDFKNDPELNDMSVFTYEFLVKPYNFNKPEHFISTIMGIEGNFLLRCGDAGIDNNAQLQIATSNGNYTDESLALDTDRWTHVALTFDNGQMKIYYDGIEKFATETKVKSVSIGAAHHNEENGKRVFWIGYSYEDARYFDGCFSEVRIWNRVLDQKEINSGNHFYEVDPATSEGLLCYWKFNEGTGTDIKDFGTKGYDLTVDKAPLWEKVSLPEKK